MKRFVPVTDFALARRSYRAPGFREDRAQGPLAETELGLSRRGGQAV